MKKSVILIVFLFVFSIQLYALSVDDLSSELKREYNNLFLSIGTNTSFDMYSNVYNLGGGVGFGIGTGVEKTEWYPYQGSQKIKKNQLFRACRVP